MFHRNQTTRSWFIYPPHMTVSALLSKTGKMEIVHSRFQCRCHAKDTKIVNVKLCLIAQVIVKMSGIIS